MEQEKCYDSEFGIDRIITEQRRIGWHLMKYGFITKELERVQDEWITHTDTGREHRSSKGWTKMVQQELCNYITVVWDARNRLIHGYQLDDIKRKRLEKLRKECLILQDKRPLVGAADRYLLDIPLADKKGVYLHH